jgi:ABC-type amino acid transport substrate-binding protein
VATTAIALQHTLFPPTKSRYETLKLDPNLIKDTGTAVLQTGIPNPNPAIIDTSIAGIRKRGALRVGFDPHVIPFSYKNGQGNLVGFDISYAYRLAHDLGVKIEFVPFSESGLNRDLAVHRFDIAMSGIYDSGARLQSLLVSAPYYESPLALIVPSTRAPDYLDGNAVAARPGLKLAVLDDPVLLPLAGRLFPQAQIVAVPSYQDLPAMMAKVDGAVWTLEQASAWASEHPGFTAVGPQNISEPIPIIYAMPPDAIELNAYLNQWLQLRTEDGFRRRQMAYWIGLRPRESQKPRWNLLDYLIHR